jgi:hypothetical protein
MFPEEINLGGDPEEDVFGEELPEDLDEAASEIPEEGDAMSLEEEPPEEPVEALSVPPSATGPVPPVPGPAPARSPKEALKKVRKPDMIGLMRYLKGLTESLPDKPRINFMQSDARLSMEYVIDCLEGRKGLFKEIQERAPQAAVRKPTPEGPKKAGSLNVAGTLAFLGKLASALPDRHLSTAITRKVDTIIMGIQTAAKNGGDHV